jgi:diguanylate cyclase (GGDEF)-like protein/PAS domain S-box-containing protein
MPGVRTLSVLDSQGKMVFASRPELLGSDYRHRPYFSAAQQNPDADTLYVSPPYLTTLGVYAVNVSRMRAGADGKFSGVVTATLDPGYFAPLLDSVRYAPDMVAAIVHSEGEVFLLLPRQADESALLARDAFIGQHRGGGQEAAVLPSAFTRGGVERMAVERTINPPGLKIDRPLVVEITRESDAIYAGWLHDVRLFGGMYLLIFFASIAGLYAYQRRQRETALRVAAAAQAVQESERFTRLVTDHLPALVAYWTIELRCRFANGAYREWFGRSPQDMIGMHIRDLLGEELFGKNETYIRAALQGERQQFERVLTKADGSTGYTWAQYIPDIDNGRVKGFFVLVADVTPLKQAQAALEESEWKLRTIVETEPECVTIFDADGCVQQMNPAGVEMLGAASEHQVRGNCLDDMLLPPYRQPFTDMLARTKLGAPATLTFELMALTGIHRWLECYAVPMRERSDRIAGTLCVMRDISERKRVEQELERQAQIDALTNLANRAHFMKLAEQELKRADRYGGPLTILMLDIDHFKKVNDTYGHECGDAVIRRFAELCRSSLRSHDIVGRVGGEEFAVMLPETDCTHARDVAELLRQRVEQTEVHARRGQVIRFTVSIGIACRTDVFHDLDALLAEADVALYRAKNSGRNRVCESEVAVGNAQADLAAKA